MEGGDPFIGFFITRQVRGGNEEDACTVVRQQVLAEWQPGVEYAAHKRGGLPALRVEDVLVLGLIAGLLARKPAGYSFYTHDD